MTQIAAPARQVLVNRDSVELFKSYRFKSPVNCVLTDPPFGVDHKSNHSVTPGGREWARKIANDLTPEQAIEVFEGVMEGLLPQTAEHSDMYVFTAESVRHEWVAYLRTLDRYGFKIKRELIWWKKEIGAGTGDLATWGSGYEVIIYLKKGRRERTAPRRGAVLDVAPIRPERLTHPHQKPNGLLKLFLEHSTSPGDLVVDPFAGSGSTLMACRELGRSALGVELDEKNFKIAQRNLDESSEGLF